MTSPVKIKFTPLKFWGTPARAGHRPYRRPGGVRPRCHSGRGGGILVMKVLKKPPLAKWWHGKPSPPTAGSRIAPTTASAVAVPSGTWITPRSCGQGQRVQDALTRLGGSSVTVEEILGAAEPPVLPQ